jgi:hypothetical protein
MRTKSLFNASEEDGVEINAKERNTVSMSRHQNAAQNNNKYAL